MKLKSIITAISFLLTRSTSPVDNNTVHFLHNNGTLSSGKLPKASNACGISYIERYRMGGLSIDLRCHCQINCFSTLLSFLCLRFYALIWLLLLRFTLTYWWSEKYFVLFGSVLA